MAEVDEGDFVVVGERLGDLFRRGILELDEDVADVRTGVLGDLFGFGELIQTDHTALQQQIGEVLHRVAHEAS